MNCRARFVVCAALAFSLGTVGSDLARAESGDRALAEQLFRNAQELMKKERYAEACPKLSESHRLDPGTGTLLNLAVCHEREGKLASAWAEYNDVITLARRDQRADRVQFAEQRIAAIEPQLSRVTIELSPGTETAGLELLLDGQRLGLAALGVAAPLDPGTHTLAVGAPGKRPWQIRIEIGSPGAQQRIVVPKLEDAPLDATKDTTQTTPGAAEARPRNTQRISGYAIAGLGVVGIGLGSYFGLRAISKNNESNDQGCMGNECPADAAATRRAAASAGNVSTIAFLVGGAALATGVVLVLTAPRSRGETKPPPQAAFRLSPGGAQLELGAKF
ncbi:MAG: hypothetical protein ACOY0T_16795 [Myxococcota bacterium]